MATIRTLDGRTIITSREPDGRWSAIEDDSYDGPGSPCGDGRSEGAAVLDLLLQLEEREEGWRHGHAERRRHHAATATP